MLTKSHCRSLVLTVSSLLLLASGLIGSITSASAQSGDEQAFQFAERLYRDGLFELAAEQFERFAEEYPNSHRQGESLLLAADCMIQLERYDSALDAYERIIERFRRGPVGCEAAFKRASILVELERPRDALRAFDTLKGTYTDCDRRYGAEVGAVEALVDLGRPDEALARLADMPGDPTQPGMLARTAYVRGRALEDAGESGNALAAYDAVVQLFPSTVWEDRSHLRRADLLAGEGFHREALVELQSVGAHGRQEAVPLRTEAELLRAGILERLGRYEEAGAAFAAAAELQSDAPAGRETALASSAAAYERAGKPRRALELLAGVPAATVDQELGLGLTYQQARLARQDQQHAVARAALERLTAMAAADTLAAAAQVLADSLAFEGLLLRVEIEVADGETGLAGRLLRAWDRTGRPALARARVEQRLGDLELSEFEHPFEARAAYQAALAAWDELPTVAPAELWMSLAAAEEALGNHAAARTAYAHVYREWPRHPRAHEALAREAYVRDYLDVDQTAALTALVRLAEDGARAAPTAEGDSAARLRRLADLQYELLKDYANALRLYEELLVMATADSLAVTELPVVLYRAGRSAILAAHRPGKSPDQRLRARGHDHFSRLVAEFPANGNADDARLALIEDEFGAPDRDRRDGRDLAAEAAAYQQFAEEFPGSNQLGNVFYCLGSIYRDAGQAAGDDSTSYAVARDYFVTVTRGYAEEDIAEEASYWSAVMASRLDLERAASTGYRDYLRLYPRGRWAADCHHQLGELALAEQRLDDAREHYGWLLNEPGDEPLARLALARLGDCELVATDYAAARRHYEALLVRDPAGPLADQAVLRLAELYQRQGEWGQAEAELRRLLADYPASPRRAEVLLRLGRMRARRGDHQGAADALASYLESESELEPATAHAVRFEQAAALQAAGQGDGALQVYERLARQTADDTLAVEVQIKARAEATMLLFDLDREKDARRAAERFARDFAAADSWLLELEIARGNYLLRHAPGQAREHFAALSEAHGDGPEADRILYGLGLVTLRAQEFDATAEHFERLIRLYPDSPLRYEAHFKLGTTYYTMKRYNDAASHYRQAAERTPDGASPTEALRNLGLSYERGERYDQAIRVYRDLARDHADSPLGLYAAFKIGFAYQEWSKFTQAIAAYREVLPRQSGVDAAETQFWIAECHEAAGQLEIAAAEYLKVGYLHPDSGMWAGTGRYRAGGVYEQLGRLDDAQAVYTALAREDPGGEWGGHAAERLRLLSQDPNQD